MRGVDFATKCIAHFIICKFCYISLYQQNYSHTHTHILSSSPTWLINIWLDIKRWLDASQGLFYPSLIFSLWCPTRVSPSCPRDDPTSLSRQTTPLSKGHQYQLSVGFFPDTRSHSYQAIAESGGLELRRRMIWGVPLRSRTLGCHSGGGKLARVGLPM